jgi:diacylglycerol kinase (ATP)
MRKIAFIVNPKSGQSRKQNRAELIRSHIPPGVLYDILLWERQGQIAELFRKALEGDYDVIAAAGGDGTVNMVATALAEAAVSGNEKSLGIIPFGSGNGLARHLGIPLDTGKAVRLVAGGKAKSIDVCRMNDKPFFCTAGVGFDAHIGKLFAESRIRGMISYAGMTLQEVLRYQPGKYKLTIDGKTLPEFKAFLVTFANAAQYGGDAYIAPLADIQDGLLDVTIIHPFSLLRGIPIVYRMFANSLQHSSQTTMLKGKHILLERSAPGPVHYDGEPDMMGERIEVTIRQGGLQVIVPDRNE